MPFSLATFVSFEMFLVSLVTSLVTFGLLVFEAVFVTLVFVISDNVVVFRLQEVCELSVIFSWSNIDSRTLLASPDENLEPACTIVLLYKRKQSDRAEDDTKAFKLYELHVKQEFRRRRCRNYWLLSVLQMS